MKRIYKILSEKTPYWVAHGLVAIAISLLTGFWLAGTIFYAGREIRDWEKLHNWKLAGFDWKGFLAPLVTSIILYFIL